MSLVFISYRKDAAPYAAHLIWEKLSDALGRDAVFIDDQHLEAGNSWRHEIFSQLDSARVVVARHRRTVEKPPTRPSGR